MELKKLFELAGVDLSDPTVLRITEGIDPDRQATEKAAAPIIAKLQQMFGQVETMWTKEGFLQVSIKANPMDGLAHRDNQYVASGQNIGSVILPYFREWRSNGWTFTQPVQNKFLLGVPIQQ